ncbi:MAG: ATP-binding protein [Clostridia bacterium]
MNFMQPLQKHLAKRPLEEDEYFNEKDKLIYCKKCDTPRQIRFERAGRVYEPYVMCKCRKEDDERREQEIKNRDFMEKIKKLKANGLQDKSLYDYCFANDKGYNDELRHAHRYVEKWEQIYKENTGLIIWGDVGTGKSFFAGCIANALLEKGVPVLMTNFARILNTMTGLFSDARNDFIDSFNHYSLLIIDDLGMERNSEFAQEQIFSIIDSRYRANKPLIVTTNLTLKELNNPTDLARSRIYNRILERCVPIKINNQNIRNINAKQNMQKAESLFK